jgi:hypothetical protein
MAMEVLSKLMQRAVQKRGFGFHPKCVKLNLSLLCLIFMAANKHSVEGLQTSG